MRTTLLLLAALLATPASAGCESQSLANDRVLLDEVDATLAALVPGTDCSGLDPVLAAADRACAELDKVRARPVVAFAGMVRNLRTACAPITPKAKDTLLTTWNNLRVTVGRGGETLSGALRGNTAADPATAP